jgi:ubiquinone/menaquinone biosynthesis C-methylase UbiE
MSGEIGFLINDARNLCFQDSSFDVVTMLAVLTLVSKSERPKIMNEVHRVLKPFGYVFIEEFGRTWENPVYAKRYKYDLRVTGETGTITVKDETGKILHFGHHFTRSELCELLGSFQIISFEKGMFTSYFHRNWVKGYVILAKKKIDQHLSRYVPTNSIKNATIDIRYESELEVKRFFQRDQKGRYD